MKKKLEADLISIAHRILKIKNKSDINQLYLETQKLYEKLAVLKFVEENFEGIKPTIGQNEITSELETIFDKEELIPVPAIAETPVPAKEASPEELNEPEKTETIAKETTEPITETTEEPLPAQVVEEIIETTDEPIAEAVEPIAEKPEEPIFEEVIEPVVEEVEKPAENNPEELSFTTVSDLKPIPDFKPAFELDKEEVQEEIKEEIKEEPKTETKPNSGHLSLEEILGVNYADAQFVKIDSFEPVSAEKKVTENPFSAVPSEPKTVTLNEKLAKGFHVDLNDRIAFTKNLFGNSAEDYSRVLNQLLTFDSYAEAKDFIENMVKPDYNNWEGKDDYAERFLGIIEKKFA